MHRTVGEALACGRAALHASGAAGRFDALRLLEEVARRNAAWIFAHADASLEDDVRVAYRTAVERRVAGEPVAYIVGSAGFYGRTFAVTPDVLIPRPESEMLVELAREALASRALARPRICDLGTGSGILAISLACDVPGARVLAVDVSDAALAVARANATAHGTLERIAFEAGDASAVLAGAARFDCVVANLPYVRSADLAPMPPEIAFEPRLALDGGPDGLALYAPLLDCLAEHVEPGGIALFEAGADTTEPLAALARATLGAGACVHIRRDYAGHARVVDVRFERVRFEERFSEPTKPSRP
ncbi:MAG: peptide chain release factor N(5)-glutamine methyltransferase [Vulcanimicrobiaceae bacterium]